MNNFSQTQRFHPKGAKAQEYKELCNKASSARVNDTVNGWKVIDKGDANNGFRGTTYEKEGKITVCFEGTNAKSIKDHGANLKMGLDGPSAQMTSALKYCENIQKNNPSAKIELAGHSEGGSEATYVGLMMDKPTYTYNAYGLTDKTLEKIVKEHPINENLITNYRDPNDPISKMKENVGTTYVVPSSQNTIMSKTPFGWLPSHRIDNMGDCNEAMPLYEYKAKNPLFIDRLSDTHITDGDIVAMPNDVFGLYEKEIDNRLNSHQITDEYSAQQMVSRGELVYVRGYKRDDGTDVRGYYRRLA